MRSFWVWQSTILWQYTLKLNLLLMKKTKSPEQSPPPPNKVLLPASPLSPSELQSSLSLSLNKEGYQSRSDTLFGVMTYHDKTEADLQASIEEIRRMSRQIEDLIDKKIGKYYTQMREKSLEREPTLEQVIEGLTNERDLRNQIMKFQQISIRDIHQQERSFDSKQNIEFAIPIQINQTKKKILQLQKFIHIAEIKQKKKSEDVVKIEKINNLQFQKIAMLRTSLEVEMISQLSLNEREMKIDDKMYDFESKLDTLNEKLARLNKVVEEKHILVSSNKGLIQLKEQKASLEKFREEANKKMALARNAISKSQLSIRREMEQMRKEIGEKQSRYVAVQKELQEIIKKNDSFLVDASINKSLRKSISYNYAETLLKVKRKERLENPESNMMMNLSLMSESQSLKPNFKVKKMVKPAHSSLSRMNPSKKNMKNITLGQGALPITLEKSVEPSEGSSFYEHRLRLSQRNKPKPVSHIPEGLDEEIVVDDD